MFIFAKKLENLTKFNKFLKVFNLFIKFICFYVNFKLDYFLVNFVFYHYFIVCFKDR